MTQGSPSQTSGSASSPTSTLPRPTDGHSAGFGSSLAPHGVFQSQTNTWCMDGIARIRYLIVTCTDGSAMGCSCMCMYVALPVRWECSSPTRAPLGVSFFEESSAPKDKRERTSSLGRAVHSNVEVEHGPHRKRTSLRRLSTSM